MTKNLYQGVFKQLQYLVCSVTVTLPEVLSRGKTSLKGFIGHCRTPTSQHSEKQLRIDVIYRCSRLYFKTLNNQKILWKTK